MLINPLSSDMSGTLYTETHCGRWIPHTPERQSGCCSSSSLYWPLGTGELVYSYPEWQQTDVCVWKSLYWIWGQNISVWKSEVIEWTERMKLGTRMWRNILDICLEGHCWLSFLFQWIEISDIRLFLFMVVKLKSNIPLISYPDDARYQNSLLTPFLSYVNWIHVFANCNSSRYLLPSSWFFAIWCFLGKIFFCFERSTVLLWLTSADSLLAV